jgi:hypothetical protein
MQYLPTRPLIQVLKNSTCLDIVILAVKRPDLIYLAARSQDSENDTSRGTPTEIIFEYVEHSTELP